RRVGRDPRARRPRHRRPHPGGDRAQRDGRDRAAAPRGAGYGQARASPCGPPRVGRSGVRDDGRGRRSAPCGGSRRPPLLLLLRRMPDDLPGGPRALRRAGGTSVNEDILRLQTAMESEGYVADAAVATALYLAREMGKPLLVEGDAGVGKTELAKV